MSSKTTPQIYWWSAIATEEPDSSDSESEDEVFPDPRPSELESREYLAFCQRMSVVPSQLRSLKYDNSKQKNRWQEHDLPGRFRGGGRPQTRPLRSPLPAFPKNTTAGARAGEGRGPVTLHSSFRN